MATKQPSTSQVVIGFPTGTSVTGVVRDNFGISSSIDIEDVRNEDNNVDCQVLSNSVAIRTVSGHVLSTYTLPAAGDVVTIDSVKYLIHDIKCEYTPTITRFTMEVRKPSAITYT